MTRIHHRLCSLLILVALQSRPTLWAGEATVSNSPLPVPAQPPYKNTAIVPVSQLEEDFYNWEERHAKVLEIQKSLDPEIILIGDSITHLWGGLPVDSHARGANAWSKTFGNHRVLNMGFGWDRTQNVLWRLEHGEMDGTHPKVVVVNIGTNNLTTSSHARANTPEEIAEAILLICERVHRKSPGSRIIVMGVFPRGFEPDDYYRTKIIELNELLAKQLVGKPKITFLDISDKFVARGAVLSRDLLSDGVHPTEAGYGIWGNALLQAEIFR